MGNAGFRFSKNTEEDEKVIPEDHWNCPKIEEIFLLLMTFDVVKMIQRWYKDDTNELECYLHHAQQVYHYHCSTYSTYMILHMFTNPAWYEKKQKTVAAIAFGGASPIWLSS